MLFRPACLQWMRNYNASDAGADLLAAAIVTLMLIPQGLAYAMLAGLPPETGLYASILPLIVYAVFGSSRVLAVGPVAVLSLMSATAIQPVVAQGLADPLSAAATLALLSGVMLLAAGLLRLGFLANFLSHPVVSGFITASGILIAAGQLRHLLGIRVEGTTLPEIVPHLIRALPQANPYSLALGCGALAFLYLVRRHGLSLLRTLLPLGLARALTRAAPILAIVTGILLVRIYDLGAEGVALVGNVPSGLPVPHLPLPSPELIVALAPSAFLISLVGFVESVSVAQTLAARRRERIVPDQELIGLGAANLAASLGGGYPVTGGFARSVVNDEAGARSPAAGLVTAVGIALAALYLTPLLADLPQAVLAATIIIAVLTLVDFGAMRRVYRYSRHDFMAMAATVLVTLALGVEPGMTAGVILSLAMQLYRSARPHSAIVGQIPGTEHFRNVERHAVQTQPDILSLRVDESLCFANARFLEDRVAELIAGNGELRHLVLMCPAVNHIDASALESLEAINRRLSDAGIDFHLSEVKGPVMDQLQRSDFLTHLSGRVFLSQHAAISQLSQGGGTDPAALRKAS